MGEPVATSVRRKKKSSLRIGQSWSLRPGRWIFSAGNTGAVMATAKMVIVLCPEWIGPRSLR